MDLDYTKIEADELRDWIRDAEDVARHQMPGTPAREIADRWVSTLRAELHRRGLS